VTTGLVHLAFQVSKRKIITHIFRRDKRLGQDITISYIETDIPLHARRLALLTDYHFHCCCERCLREESMGSTKKGSKESKGSGNRKTAGGVKAKKKGKKRK